MRVFCFIFSFYLLLLSVQSCQDFAAGDFSLSQIKNELSSLNREGENAKSENHKCSPFCICSCRQISITDNINACSSNKEIATFTKSIVQVY